MATKPQAARQTRASAVVDPIRWDAERLERDRITAIEAFRTERMKEPLKRYIGAIDVFGDAFRNLFSMTVDLRQLSRHALDVLGDETLCEALRYLPGPPISLDDLKVIADVDSMTPKALREDPRLARRLIDTVLMGLDQRRFPWIAEGREPTDKERVSAILASAALVATRKVETARRNEGKEIQEGRVRAALERHGFKRVDTRPIQTLSEAPEPGKFCMESLLGTRKADIIIGLWDRRVMAIECKVSNSATNSIKRLNNDAAAKAQAWRQDFGETQVIPVALLSGVYRLKNLEDAQDRHLMILWAHSLDELVSFIDQTKKSA